MAVRDDFSAGEVLSADDLNDTFASKLDLAGGKILQIVRATDSSTRSTTSTSYTDVTGMSVTITPQKSDSAILLLATGQVIVEWSSGDDARANFQITDNSNNAISGAEEMRYGSINLTGTGARFFYGSLFVFARSTPATTSATTYKTRFKSGNASTTSVLRGNFSTSQMFAIEVSA